MSAHPMTPDPAGRSGDQRNDSPQLQTKAEQPDHGGMGRGHMIGMVLCCIPMVIAIAWVLFANRW